LRGIEARGSDAIPAAWKAILDASQKKACTAASQRKARRVERTSPEGNVVFVEFRSGGTNSAPLVLPTAEMLPDRQARGARRGVSVSKVGARRSSTSDSPGTARVSAQD